MLDGLLRGGLPLDGVTELAGHSSAGKTQLALQLCLTVQFPPRHGGLEAGEWLSPQAGRGRVGGGGGPGRAQVALTESGPDATSRAIFPGPRLSPHAPWIPPEGEGRSEGRGPCSLPSVGSGPCSLEDPGTVSVWAQSPP